MSAQWTVPAWLLLGILAVVLIGAGTVVLRHQRVARIAAIEAASLRARIGSIELQLAEGPAPATPIRETPSLETSSPTAPVRRDFVITRLGDEPVHPLVPAPTVRAGQFADVLLRESVVRAAALLHGVRRALAPEVRHRIRFEMGREVKRARKVRRAEQRQALREWQARQRASAGESAA